jgi:hypothetical protein
VILKLPVLPDSLAQAPRPPALSPVLPAATPALERQVIDCRIS